MVRGILLLQNPSKTMDAKDESKVDSPVPIENEEGGDNSVATPTEVIPPTAEEGGDDSVATPTEVIPPTAEEGGDDSVATPTEVIPPTAAEGGGDLRDGGDLPDGHLHEMGPQQLAALRPIRIKIQSLTQ